MTQLQLYCLMFALILSSVRRVISGAKNAAFYGRSDLDRVPFHILQWIKNLHRLESPAWYSQFGACFFFLMIPALDRYLIWSAAGVAILGAMSASALASMFYQGFINESVGKPFIDPGENPKSEFAMFGLSIWWPRPWKGKFRIISSFFGAIGIFTTLYLLMR